MGQKEDMHGIIFSELRKYGVARAGDKGWEAIVTKAGLSTNLYTPIGEYPDAEVVALITAASAVIGRPVNTILEDFGEFLAPSLVAMYVHLLKPSWKALDVIENTEETIHTVVRRKNKGAHPPLLKVTRISPEEAVLIYDSPRRMCAIAKGIGRGVGNHFQEKLLITEPRCMHNGATSCEIHFRSPI